jgi:hypothetical protein
MKRLWLAAVAAGLMVAPSVAAWAASWRCPGKCPLCP